MKKTFAFAICAAVLFAGCLKQDPDVAVHDIVPPTDLVYDEVLSSSTAISIAWSSDEAVRNDALRFVAELVSSPESAEADFSRTIKTYEPRPCNTCCFTGIPEFGRYYARVKAVYEDGESEWAYFGEPSVIEAGTGRIESRDTRRVREPEARLKEATAGSLTFEWSVTGFERMKIDREADYVVSLYRNEACNDLLVSWDLPAKGKYFQGSEAGYVYVLDFPAFKFTGLDPETTYWFKVECPDGLSGAPVSAKTEKSKVVIPGNDVVAEGEYALYEDFEELIWGGDASSGAACYSSLMRSVVSSFIKAAGVNPVNTGEKFFVCNENNEGSLYGAIPQLLPSTRLDRWGRSGNEDEINFRSGCLKIGRSSNGCLVTPELTNLKQNATVILEFDARDYYVRESRSLQIDVLRGASFNPDSHIVSAPASARRKVTVLQLEGGYEFNHYSITIRNVKPGDRISFTGVKDNVSSLSRFFIDNISVKVQSY